MCVHASGTQIGLSKGGEQLQGRFDHTICYDVEGMIKSVSANWNLVPQVSLMKIASSLIIISSDHKHLRARKGQEGPRVRVGTARS
jgi:hypothetical protein